MHEEEIRLFIQWYWQEKTTIITGEINYDCFLINIICKCTVKQWLKKDTMNNRRKVLFLQNGGCRNLWGHCLKFHELLKSIGYFIDTVVSDLTCRHAAHCSIGCVKLWLYLYLCRYCVELFLFFKCQNIEYY